MNEHGRVPGGGPTGSWPPPLGGQPPPVQDPQQRAHNQERAWAVARHLAALSTFVGIPFAVDSKRLITRYA